MWVHGRQLEAANTIAIVVDKNGVIVYGFDVFELYKEQVMNDYYDRMWSRLMIRIVAERKFGKGRKLAYT